MSRLRTAIVLVPLLVLIFCTGLMARPGDPSKATLAERALVAGDLPLARDLFEQWLEADPSDYVSWYNFACTRALLGDTLGALATLENACTAGWTDSAWTAGDPDLKAVRSHKRFEAILKRMGTAAAHIASGVEREEYLYVRQSALTPCMVVKSPGYVPDENKPVPLIVLLHDRGQDIKDMRDLVERMAVPNVLYAIPRAPYPVEEARGGFEYWPRDLALTGAADAATNARALSADWYADLVQSLMETESVDPENIYLVGYAQGGAAALLAGLEHPAPWQGIASIAGYLPESHRERVRFDQLKQAGTSIFLGHGSNDREVTKSEASIIEELCETSGVDVTLRMYPAEHELSDEMVLDLVLWLEEQMERVSMQSQQP
ncbi:dienelactone hydrolase family protein [bacterium]|nr:dienelactone hydrolase family protein [bacterium]